jgi:hypothetical protein
LQAAKKKAATKKRTSKESESKDTNASKKKKRSNQTSNDAGEKKQKSSKSKTKSRASVCQKQPKSTEQKKNKKEPASVKNVTTTIAAQGHALPSPPPAFVNSARSVTCGNAVKYVYELTFNIRENELLIPIGNKPQSWRTIFKTGNPTLIMYYINSYSSQVVDGKSGCVVDIKLRPVLL